MVKRISVFKYRLQGQEEVSLQRKRKHFSTRRFHLGVLGTSFRVQAQNIGIGRAIYRIQHYGFRAIMEVTPRGLQGSRAFRGVLESYRVRSKNVGI